MVNLRQSERKGGGAQKWKKKERSCKATVSLGYKTFGQEDDRDDKATAIVFKDDHTKMIFGHVCERKGASDTWVIEKIKEYIARLGCQDVILKGDGEPALVQVLENVNLAREAPSVVQHSLACDQDCMGQVAIKIGLEAVEVQSGVRLEDHGMDHGTRRRVAESRTAGKGWPNSVLQVVRQE